MTMDEAGRRLADLLNEMGAEGIAVEAAIGSLILTTEGTYTGAVAVSPVDYANIVWKIE